MSVYKPLKCLRCGHEWIARIMNVGRCPNCKSHLWNQPKKNSKMTISSKSELLRLTDLLAEMNVPFRSAAIQSVQVEPDEGKPTSEGEFLKSRHQIKVAGVDFLFDEKGTFLGIDSGAKFLPRK